MSSLAAQGLKDDRASPSPKELATGDRVRPLVRFGG